MNQLEIDEDINFVFLEDVGSKVASFNFKKNIEGWYITISSALTIP
jgi:hypothetical protein